MADSYEVSRKPKSISASSLDRISWGVALLACVIILAAKMLLVTRININWDEFYYLSLIYALLRQEHIGAFQTAYTHLFTWVPRLGGDEVTQIVTARTLMVMLLVVTVFLIARLASRFVPARLVWSAPLAFLAMMATIQHGGSFRADSLLAPLSLAVILCWTSPTKSRRQAIGAGVWFGLALVVTAKAVLLLPVLCAFEVARAASGPGSAKHCLVQSARRLALFGVVAALLTGALMYLHDLALPTTGPVTGQTLTSRTFRPLLDVTFLPRWDYLAESFQVDAATWIVIAAGLVFAVLRRRWAAVACASSLLPLLFYRNSFPYYYPVILAPVCVLASVAIEELERIATRGRDSAPPYWLPAAACIPLVLQAGVNLSWNLVDAVARERAVVAAVHQIFPQPVPYIDHSGMIASFRKVNFFMSTWGVSLYRERGISFMREALARDRPPLLLANREELEPGSAAFGMLLPEDQQLIRRFYLPYWGPIRVAGAQAMVPAHDTVQVALPFPGRYRLESAVALQVNGVKRAPQEEVEITGISAALSAPAANESVLARLVWAAAEPPPVEAPPSWVYLGL